MQYILTKQELDDLIPVKQYEEKCRQILDLNKLVLNLKKRCGKVSLNLWRNSMKERKKPSQSWIEKSNYEIENAGRLLAERIEKVKELRKIKENRL